MNSTHKVAGGVPSRRSGGPRAAGGLIGGLLALGAAMLFAPPAAAAVSCERTVAARVVALDQPLMFNRLGAQNINGMVYALRRDVVQRTGVAGPGEGLPEAAGGTLAAGAVALRTDKRPRPLVLRVAAGDCLRVEFQNLLAGAANPDLDQIDGVPPFNLDIDDQIATRHVGFHPQGMQLVGSIASDASFVGRNASSLAAPTESRTYTFFAEHEGAYVVSNPGASFGGEGSAGNTGNGLFAQVIVEPKRARIYRSQVTEEELRLATTGMAASGHPIINYEATYPAAAPWTTEGKAGLPVLNMITAANEIVHSDINAIIAGPNTDGTFPSDTYPLESVGKRNPTLPTRLEAFREFASVWHDEGVVAQAFPGWFEDDVFSHTLHGVRDGFMINYGSGGVGAEVIANRLGVGPMHDCAACQYEEFFLTSHVVGDPALLVDVPANVGLEGCTPALGDACVRPAATRANKALYPEDPANVHHSYTGDFVKFRNTHSGKEQHVFHLHNHQWLFNPNDDNSNYIDAQSLGSGVSYTYEINFGGSGNRNKTAGDAIYHCHFYPHFAQGMWYLWRVHDAFEAGTQLTVSGGKASFHSVAFALKDGTPAADARALPDGELVVGSPIPAVVPLPGKPMAPLPGKVTVVPKWADSGPIGSVAQVDRTDVNPATGVLKNPGYPFWIAGIEHTVGQRPPTPPLDMLTEAQAIALKAGQPDLFGDLEPASAGGWDGGLPRLTMAGIAAGSAFQATQNRLDFTKFLTKIKPVYFAEEGTDVEQAAMRFHAERKHPSVAVLLDGTTVAGDFVTNGLKPAVGAPYNEPCIDDKGRRVVKGGTAEFFSAVPGGFFTADPAKIAFGAANPRIYKGANIQFDAVLNKAGYHYPQQRILTLWEDVMPVINKEKPPEPLVMRLNTYDCAVYHHTNLVPHVFELDDYQVRTPTDIIGQHIHLPKWDLTTADGSGNGWNYEDGTFSPAQVQEVVKAINCHNGTGPCLNGATPAATPVATPDGRTQLAAQDHPFFAARAAQLGGAFPGLWKGARTTMQRWFADPVVNVAGVDRGLGIIFTHDHFGPSTHQQVGLYATVLIEPAGSTWMHNELNVQLGVAPDGSNPSGRTDGGPTSWQARILAGDGGKDSYREFFLQYSDFQHAYEAGVYVGADARGVPMPTEITETAGGRAVAPALASTFRRAINPSVREDSSPVFPDLYVEAKLCPGGEPRPCPEAISADDPGMLVVNYRNESIGLRVYDPNKPGPDNGQPGAQADGLAGDLAYALQSRTDRKFEVAGASFGPINPATGNRQVMNAQPRQGDAIGGTSFPAPINAGGVGDGDPFTPMLRAYAGDMVRVKIQAGGDEEEHNLTIHGVKWLQGGSSFGAAPNSGWRNFQAAGISEQFTFAAPATIDVRRLPYNTPFVDYAYSADASVEGWWNGMWGLMRVYAANQPDLPVLPNKPKPALMGNVADYQSGGVCPRTAPNKYVDITAVLANSVLPNVPGVTIPANAAPTDNVGGPLDPAGGTLVYNSRTTDIPLQTFINEEGEQVSIGGHSGPLHDPTAILYVRTADLDATTGKLKAGRPVEPVVIRAAAGDCINVTLRNKLPTAMPDLASFTTMQGVVKRDRDNAEGSTTFQNNLIRPSAHVGMHTQLVDYDATRGDGTNVGRNAVQTAAPGGIIRYQWYAGDRRITSYDPGSGSATIAATPIEFGGANVTPADKIKQGQKSLVGTLVVEPKGATWTEDADDASKTRKTRAAATVMANGQSHRSFSAVMQKGLSMRYGDGAPVENIGGEGPGVPEDPQDAGHMAINYRSEPMWFRFGRPANTPFGHGGLGEIANAHEAYSNTQAGATCAANPNDPACDPQTPVFTAAANSPVRLHVTLPHGGARGTTVNLHGQVWQRDPFVCPGAYLGLAGLCAPGEVGSQALGVNPLAIYTGGQESHNAYSHWTLYLPAAGGAGGVTGDYLFRDQAGFGNLMGLWGILRVEQ